MQHAKSNAEKAEDRIMLVREYNKGIRCDTKINRYERKLTLLTVNYQKLRAIKIQKNLTDN